MKGSFHRIAGVLVMALLSASVYAERIAMIGLVRFYAGREGQPFNLYFRPTTGP